MIVALHSDIRPVNTCRLRIGQVSPFTRSAEIDAFRRPVRVVSGSVRFGSGSDQRIISAGEIAALDRDIARSLEALDESALILTTAIG